MQKIKQLLLVSAVFIFGSTLAVPALAYAHGDGSEDDSSVLQSSSGEDKEDGDHKKRTKELAEQFKKEAKEKNEEVKNRVKEKTAEQRQKACEARKSSIETRLAGKVERAKSHKAKFDAIFLRVKTYHDENGLNTPDYATLVAAVDAAHADVEAQIAALEALEVNIDCANSTVTDSLAAFREAVISTKTSLKAYKTSIKNLITAVRQSAEDVQNSSTN